MSQIRTFCSLVCQDDFVFDAQYVEQNVSSEHKRPKHSKQDGQYTYHVKMRCVRVTISAVEKS